MFASRTFWRPLLAVLALGLGLGLFSVVHAAEPPSGGPASDVVAGPVVSPTCTPAWNVSFSPSPAGLSSQLSALGVVAANNIWAVGYTRVTTTSIHTLMEHWNGITWSIVQTPEPA